MLSCDVEAVAQVLSTLTRGREGKNGIIACSCPAQLIRNVLMHTNGGVIFLGPFCKSTLSEA